MKNLIHPTCTGTTICSLWRVASFLIDLIQPAVYVDKQHLYLYIVQKAFVVVLVSLIA